MSRIDPPQFQIKNKDSPLSRTPLKPLLMSVSSLTALTRIEVDVFQMKDQLISLTDFPSMLGSLSEQMTSEIINLTNHYNSVITQLKSRCENLRSALINFQEVKQLEKHRLIEELEDKDQTIRDLLSRMQIQQRKYTTKAKESASYPGLAFQIKSLQQNNEKLLEVIGRYQDHISQLEQRRKSQDKCRPERTDESLKNSFLKQRYFQFKKENSILKSRLTSIANSQVKEFRLDSENTFRGSLKLGSQVPKHHRESLAYKKHNLSVKTSKAGSRERTLGDQIPLKTPKQKIKELLDKYQERQGNKRIRNAPNNSPIRNSNLSHKRGNHQIVSNFLSTLRSV